MSNIVRLGYHEAAAMTIIFILTKAFLGYPRMVIIMGGQAAWLVVLINMVVALGAWLVISFLLARYPGKSLPMVNEAVLGPFLGLGANTILFLYTMFNSLFCD